MSTATMVAGSCPETSSMKPELAGKADGWRMVAFVLVAGGNNDEFQITDFYVDPRMSVGARRPGHPLGSFAPEALPGRPATERRNMRPAFIERSGEGVEPSKRRVATPCRF